MKPLTTKSVSEMSLFDFMFSKKYASSTIVSFVCMLFVMICLFSFIASLSPDKPSNDGMILMYMIVTFGALVLTVLWVWSKKTGLEDKEFEENEAQQERAENIVRIRKALATIAIIQSEIDTGNAVGYLQKLIEKLNTEYKKACKSSCCHEDHINYLIRFLHPQHILDNNQEDL